MSKKVVHGMELNPGSPSMQNNSSKTITRTNSLFITLKLSRNHTGYICYSVLFNIGK